MRLRPNWQIQRRARWEAWEPSAWDVARDRIESMRVGRQLERVDADLEYTDRRGIDINSSATHLRIGPEVSEIRVDTEKDGPESPEEIFSRVVLGQVELRHREALRVGHRTVGLAHG